MPHYTTTDLISPRTLDGLSPQDRARADQWAEALSDMLTGLRLTPEQVAGGEYVWDGEIPTEENQDAEIERYVRHLCDPRASDALAGIGESPDETDEETLAARVDWLDEQGWLEDSLFAGERGEALVSTARALLDSASECAEPPITTLAAALRLAYALPAGVDVADCEWYTVDGRDVLVLPGYVCDWQATAEIAYPDAESAREAAREYVDTGSWGGDEGVTETQWVSIDTWRPGLALDGREVRVEEEGFSITLEPPVPPCVEEEDHEWRSPFAVLGGDRQNPGVWGHGGGVIIREVCRHCGTYQITDTWAQDMETGIQGLRSIRYEEADEDSLAWVARQQAQADGRDDS